MTQSKISNFSNIMEEYSPELQMSELKKSNLADLGSVLLESSRKSKFMTGVKILKVQKQQPIEPIDSNSIKLLRGAIIPKRQLPAKQGDLLMYISVVCCFGYNYDKQKVRCTLHRNILTIQHNSQKRHICFDTTNVNLIAKGRTQFELQIPGTEVNFVLKANSEIERQSWIKNLQRCISKAYSFRKDFKQTISYPLFQQKRWALEAQFVETCNSGDILLFKSSHTYGKLQQMITFSDYDHVGIVLKNKKNEIVIFESNSSQGVSFMFWKQMIYYKLYQGIPRLAWRKLNMQRTERDIAIMQDFVMANLHKQFEINMNKFFRFQSVLHKTQKQQKQRTFFCSQLVAAFYKKLGILDPQKATTQYWPVSFSDAKELSLRRGKLQPQKIIVFEEQAMQRRRNK